MVDSTAVVYPENFSWGGDILKKCMKFWNWHLGLPLLNSRKGEKRNTTWDGLGMCIGGLIQLWYDVSKVCLYN